MVVNNEVMDWVNLPEPLPGHPNESLLWEAKEAIQTIDTLSEKPDIKNAFVKRLEEYRTEIIQASMPIQTTAHSIAFMGNIGVGKTTALCRLVGLEASAGDKSDPVLEVGAGGTTVCEVSLVPGDDYSISIEPRDEAEIRREVREFARYHLEALQTPDLESEEADSHGTSKEIERAIRNMSGLTTRRGRQPDGTRWRVDEARNLARDFTNVESLASEILRKMNLESRTTRELRHSQESLGGDPLAWLKETFAQVNNGRHQRVSLPIRMEISVPYRVLEEESLSISIVDTKGIDDTAQREDLEFHFRDPNTVVILCSSFNDAPAPSVQQLLERGQEGQFPKLADKAAVLILPRPSEALAAKDDQGFTAADSAEGYELKIDQAEMRLQSGRLPFVKIQCFNVQEDNPADTRDFLLELVSSLREKHSEHLQEAINGANAMAQNFEAEQTSAVLRDAARDLSFWLKNNGELAPATVNLHDSLSQAINDVHASSLRASINREGKWSKLDYPYQLGYGTRVMAAHAISLKRQEFQTITRNLIANPGLEDAHGLIEQARSIFESGINNVLARSQNMGRLVHTHHMEDSAYFWSLCRDEWGKGPGYRDRVSGHHEKWFADNGNLAAEIQSAIEAEWKQILERVLAILPED